MTLSTLNYGNYGIFFIMGNAGFCPSTVSMAFDEKKSRSQHLEHDDLCGASLSFTDVGTWFSVRGKKKSPLYQTLQN